MLYIPVKLLRRAECEKLDDVPGTRPSDGLEHQVRHHRLAYVLFPDQLENGSVVEPARRNQDRGVVAQTAGPLVPQIEAGYVELQIGRGRRPAFGNVELEQRSGPAAVSGAPAAG